MTTERGNRRTKQGVVISNKMAKTVVVKVERTLRDARYSKVITKSKKYYAHNEEQSLQPGDRVTIVESRPISKLKCWRVVAKES